MASILKLSEETIATLKDEFEKQIRQPMVSNDITFKKTVQIKKTEKIPKVNIYMTASAWAKQSYLIKHYSTEVAWRGVVDRVDDYTFLIKDILLYPQTVGAATVTVDDSKYAEWMMEMCQREDDTFEKLRFQGHSHVNMGVTPSSVDIEHQEDTVIDLMNDSYNIFMIANKSGDMWIKLYDKKTNIVYGKDDIIFDVILEGDDLLSDFLTEAETFVSRKSYYSYSSKGSAVATKKDNTTKKDTQPLKRNISIHADESEYERDYYDSLYDRDCPPSYLRGLDKDFWKTGGNKK